jgi:hypothetical protein
VLIGGVVVVGVVVFADFAPLPDDPPPVQPAATTEIVIAADLTNVRVLSPRKLLTMCPPTAAPRRPIPIG